LIKVKLFGFDKQQCGPTDPALTIDANDCDLPAPG
jgi:hypothetical protein